MTGDAKTTAPGPTVFVVDDDLHVREAIELLLDSLNQRVETFSSAHDFLEHFDPGRPGCLVLDVRMPGMSGLELQRTLTDKGIRIPTLLLTAHAEVPMAVEALKAGALDFIEKPYSPQGLLDQINRALAEDVRVRKEISQREKIQERLEGLTEREQQVMRLLVDGRNARSISHILGISEKTVDFHRRNVLEKMQVPTLVELCRAVDRFESLQVDTDKR